MRILFHGARALAVCLVLTAVLAACGGAAEPAGALAVESVTFMRDDGSGNPGSTVTSFKPSDQKIHAAAKLNQITTNFNGKVVWTAVETSEGNNLMIAETAISGLAADTLSANMSLPVDWPVGKYKVEFYQAEALLKSQEFTVQP